MVLAVSDLDKAAGIQQRLFLRHGGGRGSAIQVIHDQGDISFVV